MIATPQTATFLVREGYTIAALIDEDGFLTQCPISTELLNDDGYEFAHRELINMLVQSRKDGRAKEAE